MTHAHRPDTTDVDAALVDIGHSSLKVLDGGAGLELVLERDARGRLTAASREAAARRLAEFLAGRRPGRGATPRAEPRGGARRTVCGIPARGVSLRCFALPAVPAPERERIVALQVEKELPLPPSDLVWGFAVESLNGALAPEEAPPATGGASEEVYVAVLRREVLVDYAELLAACGRRPIFRLGVLAASRLCPPVRGSYLVLDAGRSHTEMLACAEPARAVSVRSLPWGGDDLTRALADRWGVSFADAEARKCSGAHVPADTAASAAIAAVAREEARRLARLVAGVWTRGGCGRGPLPARIFLAGGGARLEGFDRALEDSLCEALEDRQGGASERPPRCERLDVEPAPGRSAVTLGLFALESDAARGAREVQPVLELRARQEATAALRRRLPVAVARWAIAASALAVVLLVLRYGVPLWRAAGVREEIRDRRARLESMPKVDDELAFLDHLASRQRPYLEAVTALANLSPPGTFLEKVSIDIAGSVSASGRVPQFDLLNEYLGKLDSSGWFASVVVHDQTWSNVEQRKGVIFRLSARLRASAESMPELPPTPPRRPPPQGQGPPQAQPPPAQPPQPAQAPPQALAQPGNAAPAPQQPGAPAVPSPVAPPGESGPILVAPQGRTSVLRIESGGVIFSGESFGDSEAARAVEAIGAVRLEDAVEESTRAEKVDP